MSKKISSIIGIIIGLAIVAFAFVVFQNGQNVKEPSMKTLYSTVSAPEEEEDLAYGGDAYTGMQQAAAQAANNLIPVYDAINLANAQAHADAAEQAKAAARNTAMLVNAIGFLLLSVGLLTIGKHLPQLFNNEKPQPQVARTTSASCPGTVLIPVSTPAPAAPTVQHKTVQMDGYWICPDCGTKNLNNRPDCWSCGFKK